MTVTSAVATEVSAAYLEFEQRLQRQREQYATRWIYSPMINVPVQAFPHLQILGGHVTPLSGDALPRHYGLRDVDQEAIANSGGLIQPTENGRNYFSYIPPGEVAGQIVQANLVTQVVELIELCGIPASEAEQINRAMFGNLGNSAPARVQRLKDLVKREGLDTKIFMTANRIIVSTETMYREALNVVRRAKVRAEKEGGGYDEYEFRCFDFTETPLTESERQGAPATPANPLLEAVLAQNAEIVKQNAELQKQYLTLQAENAKHSAKLIDLIATLAGEVPAKENPPSGPKGKSK